MAVDWKSIFDEVQNYKNGTGKYSLKRKTRRADENSGIGKYTVNEIRRPVDNSVKSYKATPITRRADENSGSNNIKKIKRRIEK